MQYTAACLAVAGLASAAVLPRTSDTFNIIEFGFSGTPHSLIADYSFNVSDGSGPSVRCMTTTSTSPEITTFGQTACEDPLWSFAWEPLNESNNTQVRIVRQPAGLPDTANLTATREFTPDDIKISKGTTPTGDVYYLSTGEDAGTFSLTAMTAQ